MPGQLTHARERTWQLINVSMPGLLPSIFPGGNSRPLRWEEIPHLGPASTALLTSPLQGVPSQHRDKLAGPSTPAPWEFGISQALLARVCIGQRILNCIRLGAAGVDEKAIPVLALLDLYRPPNHPEPQVAQGLIRLKIMSREFISHYV